MKLPPALEFLRETAMWRAARDRRYLRAHRAQSQFYAQWVRPGGLVFDIGANVGHHTLIFERLGARVLAVEPQAELVAGLRRRFARRHAVRILRAALGPAPSTAVLRKTPGQTEIASLRDDIAARSRFAGEHHFTATESVPVTTLDALVAEHGTPDFCKIDVEGFECEVLAGLTRPLPLLSLEFNREFWPETLRCLARLDLLGAYRFNFACAETCSLFHPGWMDSAALISELGANPDPLLWGDIYARAQ